MTEDAQKNKVDPNKQIEIANNVNALSLLKKT